MHFLLLESVNCDGGRQYECCKHLQVLEAPLIVTLQHLQPLGALRAQCDPTNT